jgi:hypothetical protein
MRFWVRNRFWEAGQFGGARLLTSRWAWLCLKRFAAREDARPTETRNWRSGLFLQVAELVFQLRDSGVQAFQNFPRLGGDGHAVFAMMARGGAAFDGVFKFLAAGAAGAGSLAGAEWGGHVKYI